MVESIAKDQVNGLRRQPSALRRHSVQPSASFSNSDVLPPENFIESATHVAFLEEGRVGPPEHPR